MKVVVIYSSQTGNTEKIAYAIHTGVKQITGHCDIFRMKESNPRRLYEYDLIGVGAPTHGGKEPAWVDAFIKNMRFVGGKHCFAFSTHATLPANFMASIIPKLKEKGLILIDYGDWYGDGHAQHHAYPWYTHGHPDEIDLEEAEAFGREVVVRSGRISRGKTNLIPEVPAMIDIFPKMEKVLRKGLPPIRKVAKYEKEKCLYPACRLCMDNCPADGIDLTVDPPVFMQPCYYCGGICEAICPTGAINWDAWWALPKPAAEKDHIIEFGVPAIREAEKQGRFRPLIPEEAVNWDTRVWKEFPKHPRWINGKGRP